jgi:hypothetical protein
MYAYLSRGRFPSSIPTKLSYFLVTTAMSVTRTKYLIILCERVFLLMLTDLLVIKYSTDKILAGIDF